MSNEPYCFETTALDLMCCFPYPKKWNKNELTEGAFPSVWNSLSEWPALPHNSPPRHCSTFNSVLGAGETCLS